MMGKRFVHFGGVAAVALGIAFGTATAGPALADTSAPTLNPSNCAGVVVSSLAGPGFGDAVSSLAQPPVQAVDNLGLAACGSNNDVRQNP
jgi:hypothetical protein